MKKFLLLSILVVAVAGCHDRDTEPDFNAQFCGATRTFQANVENTTGELVYLEDTKRYAIRSLPGPSAIDAVTFYVLCSKPSNINLNDPVKFNGKAYRFNADEAFIPAVGGTAYYYLDQPEVTGLQPYR